MTLVDHLPGEVRLVSTSAWSGSCSTTRDNTVTCTIFGLVTGDTATVTIAVSPKRVGTIANAASVSSNVADPSPANNAAWETTTVVR